MAYGDPVLQRPLFQTSPGMTPTVGGTSPDDNARALRNMFAPTVSIDMPTQMLQQGQQPIQSFQTGGLALARMRDADVTEEAGAYPFRASFGQSLGGGMPPVPGSAVARSAQRRAQSDTASPAILAQEEVLSSPVAQEAMRMMEEGRILRNREMYTRGLSTLQGLTGEAYSRRENMPTAGQPPAAAPAPAPAPVPTGGIAGLPVASASVDDLARMRDVDRTAESGAFMGRPAPAAPPMAATPAPERQKGALELTLEGIRAERARSSEDKRQNALLALMQAGFAMAAGRSPNALSNIAAGGQAGVGAFAAMEKDRRADLSALRREETAVILERERMRAQEERQPEAIRTYAALGGWDPSKGREGFDEAVRRGIEVTKTMQQDPETVRTFRALGNGDLMKGFEIFNADKKLQAAIAITKDITANEEDKRAANDYIRGQLTRARTGGGGFAGFSATPVR